MHKRALKKPDGRNLYLYARREIPEGLEAPSPSSRPVIANPQLRWHPLRGEWVAYASHRQERTFLPPADYNPLAPTRSREVPTELPGGAYDMAVFENLFPSLSLTAPEPVAPRGVLSRSGVGVCEVVVFTQDSTSSLSRLSLSELVLLLEVWADRTAELGGKPEIQYVMPFENRGIEVGVTLHHPHGQIYAYPFIPPVPARSLEMEAAYFERTGRALLEDEITRETAEGAASSRVLYAGERAVSFVPAFARYPYEAWVAPRKQVASLPEMGSEDRLDLARALKTTLMKYDGLWKRPFPYLMVVHQAPTDGRAHPETHLRIELSPPYRTETRLKYLAGTEIGAGLFSNDTLPEDKAAELRAVSVNLGDATDG